MTWHREKLALLYQEATGNSEVKTAARGGKRHSRKKIDKKRVDSLDSYHQAKSKYQELQEKKKEIESQLDKSRQDMQDSRSDMLRYNDVLRNMDLLACRHVTLYNNSDDIGYIVDKEEHHLDVDDCGDVSLTPMKEYRRYLKQQNQETNEADDQDEPEEEEEEDDTSDAHDGAVGALIPGMDKLTDAESTWNENEFTEELYPSRHPNFRFGE